MLNKNSTLEEWQEAVHDCHNRHEVDMTIEINHVVKSFIKHRRGLMKEEYRNEKAMILNVVFDTIKMSNGDMIVIDAGKEVIDFFMN